MPCKVYLENNILRIDFSAVVAQQDFNEFAPVVEGFERHASIVPHRITDLSQTSGLHIGFPEMLALAERRKARRFPNAFKSAIVAPQPVQVGLARMYQMLNDHPQITIEIFSDLPSAQAWLAAP